MKRKIHWGITGLLAMLVFFLFWQSRALQAEAIEEGMRARDQAQHLAALMQERERLMVALNPIEAGVPINPRPMAAGLSPRLQPVETAGD